MKYLLLILFTACLSSTHAQTDTTIQVFEKVEVEASYQEPGGWVGFLQQNLNSDIPVKRRAPAGSYQVIVQFIVGKDGSIEQVKPLTHFGFGMEEEVMRVIRKSPKWNPAMQNGRTVRAYRKQPITFVVPKK